MYVACVKFYMGRPRGRVWGGRPRDQAWVWAWEDPLEKGMATYFSILAWRIPWTEETGGLQSMGSPRVGQD